jgi:hypothetical protein
LASIGVYYLTLSWANLTRLILQGFLFILLLCLGAMLSGDMAQLINIFKKKKIQH